MLKLIDNLLIQQILAGKSLWEERMLKFVKRIEINLNFCPFSDKVHGALARESL